MAVELTKVEVERRKARIATFHDPDPLASSVLDSSNSAIERCELTNHGRPSQVVGVIITTPGKAQRVKMTQLDVQIGRDRDSYDYDQDRRDLGPIN